MLQISLCLSVLFRLILFKYTSVFKRYIHRITASSSEFHGRCLMSTEQHKNPTELYLIWKREGKRKETDTFTGTFLTSLIIVTNLNVYSLNQATHEHSHTAHVKSSFNKKTFLDF